MAFRLTSPASQNGGSTPQKYTADGANVSSPLTWSDPPEDTRSYVLIIEDPDAPTGAFRHWGLYNIVAGGRSTLPEGIEHDVKTEPSNWRQAEVK